MYTAATVHMLEVRPLYQQLYVGDSAEFYCHSLTIPSWKWTHRNEIEDRYFIKNYTLRISSVKLSDKAMYICYGTNTEGRNFQRIGELIVKGEF